jgi:hypothetical protein
MESLLATVLLAVPLTARLSRTILLDAKIEVGAILERAARVLSNLPEFQFCCNRRAPGFRTGCTAVDEVSR